MNIDISTILSIGAFIIALFAALGGFKKDTTQMALELRDRLVEDLKAQTEELKAIKDEKKELIRLAQQDKEDLIAKHETELDFIIKTQTSEIEQMRNDYVEIVNKANNAYKVIGKMQIKVEELKTLLISLVDVCAAYRKQLEEHDITPVVDLPDIDVRMLDITVD